LRVEDNLRLYVNVSGIEFFFYVIVCLPLESIDKLFTIVRAKWILNILLLFGGLILLEDLKRRLVDPVEEPPGV
jgi:hypothetical protein